MLRFSFTSLKFCTQKTVSFCYDLMIHRRLLLGFSQQNSINCQVTSQETMVLHHQEDGLWRIIPAIRGSWRGHDVEAYSGHRFRTVWKTRFHLDGSGTFLKNIVAQVFFFPSRVAMAIDLQKPSNQKEGCTHTHTYIHTDMRENDGMSQLAMWLSQSLELISARWMASGFGKPYMVEGREELPAFHMTAMLVSVTEQLVGLQERNHGVTR